MTQAESVTLSLQDQVSGPATAIGAQLASVEAQAVATRAALSASGGETAGLQAAGGAAQGLAGDLAAARAQANALAAAPAVDPAPLEDAARAAEEFAASANKAAQATDAGGAAAGGAKIPFEALAGATTTLGGAAGGTAAKGLNLVKFLGQLGPYGAIAVVAILGVVAAFAALYAIVSKAASASDAARTELLTLTGAMHGNAAAAAELQATISQVAAGSALGRDKVAEYAGALAKAKLSGAELQRALEAASIAGSAGGDEVAAAFLRDVAAAKAAGQSVDALSAKMKAQLGGVARAQALGLSVQFKKLGENITEIFSGATLDPFLGALENTLSLFSQNTQIGQQFKAVLTQAMDGFFAAAARVMPYVKEGLVGLAIVAVQVYIGYAKIRNAIMEMVGPTDEAGASATGLAVALEAGQAIAWALVIVFGAIAAVIAAVVAVAAVFYGMFIAIGKAGAWIGEQIVAAFQSIANLDLSSIASGLIDGLVSGITGSIGRVVAAMTHLAESAVSAMKSALDMHSPSRIFREDIGEMGIGEAVALGVDDSADTVETSLENVATAPDVKASAKSARADGARIIYIEKQVIQSREDWADFLAMARGEFEVEMLDGAT